MKKHSDYSMLLASLSVTALLIGLAVGWFGQRMMTAAQNDANAEDNKPAAPILAAPVVIGQAKNKEMAAIRPFIGRLTEIQKVVLSPEVSGILQKLSVDEGDSVTKDETVIAEIDQTWTDIALRQADVQINLLTVQLELQQKELERLFTLLPNRIVTESEITQQRIITEQLEKQIDAAKLAKEEAQERLKRSKIVAPFDGIVVRKSAEVGQYVSTGTEIIEMISRGEVYAEVPVGEFYLKQLSIGKTISIYVEALAKTVSGKVEAIVPYGPTSSRTFPVKIRLQDPQNELKVGMSVTAYIETRSASQGIVVPKDAVWIQPQGDSIWVMTPNAEQPQKEELVGKVRKIPVSILVRGVDEYMIEPAISENAHEIVDDTLVVTEGLERLSDNQDVRVVTIDPKFYENLPKAFGHQVITPQPRKDAAEEKKEEPTSNEK
ncbi:MAG: efflux RND transporter periplasmic adaptor subunit [Planctomycetaceae bacterium]|jgi:RND family efflux transporter MFP subunit|nr:efflux RND transporter periplasmic adaptor subunit [Planctomycetaceae bacterium]